MTDHEWLLLIELFLCSFLSFLGSIFLIFSSLKSGQSPSTSAFSMMFL